MRGVHYVACLVLVALAAPLSAAPPDVPQNVRAEPGQISEVVIRAPAGQEIGYRLIGDALFRELKTDTPGERVFWFSAKAGGTYSVVWWAKGETASAVTTITTGPPVPPKPDPAPDPKPKPDPAPAPVKVDSVWVIVVEDATAMRTVATAIALNDGWWAALKPKHDFRHYASTNPTAVSNGYVEQAKAKGYPAVLILNAADGDVLRAFKFTGIGGIKDAVTEVVK